MNEIELTPYAPNLVESTRSIGYSFHTALADIIDNSVSNLAKRVDVRYSSSENPFVAIIDDGIGMSKNILEQAMRYGSQSALQTRENHDLGRFGLGLKMASLSQCRKLTVISKFRGKISAATWDLDYIYKTEKWSLIIYNEKEIVNLKFYNELSQYESGTVVLWENLDRIADNEFEFEKEFNEKIDFADKHLSLVFHRFLSNKLNKQSFDLFFNLRKVEPIDPYFLSNPGTQQLEPETVFVEKIPIDVTPYISPYMSKLTQKERELLTEYKDLEIKQGLYIYRNKRLIVWGKWFRLLSDTDLNRLAKIRIDLPNNIDEIWTIDVKKSSAQIPATIREELKQIVERTVGKSERVFQYRGRKVSNDNLVHVWNKIQTRDKVSYQLNKEFPMYQALKNSLDDNQLRLFNMIINLIEDNFPYSAVYYDLAKDKGYEEKSLEDETVYSMMFEFYLTSKSNNLNDEQIIKILRNTDAFSKYSDVIERIEKELGGN